jgi:quinol monooxygenase YgiN
MVMKNKNIRLVLSFEVNDFELFRGIAKECSQYAASSEAGTLAYDWYVSDDKLTGKLFEIYESAAALEAHLLGPIFTQIAPKFKKSIRFVSVDSFGVLPDIFHKLFGALPNSNWPMPEVEL